MRSDNSQYESPPNQNRDAARGDIAIVGMSCIFPGAPNLESYWKNIVAKLDSITDPPAEAWNADVFYDPDSTENDRVYCKRGGYIGPLAEFDPLEHGIMPRTAEGGEPDQWLALKVAEAALRDAGYEDDIPERHRTAVVVGKGTYLNRGNLSAAQHGQVMDQTLQILRRLHPELTQPDLQLIRSELKSQLPPFNADTAPALVPNIIAGRIANRLDLMGPSYTVDAACASSLLAVDHAIRDLRNGQCDLALVGGAHVVTPVPVLMLFCQLDALSHAQQIRPFDKKADGTILGEGIGMIVLKRLEDALRDGHRIYAVVKEVGTSSDGRGMSVMAPRLEGEVLAMERAYTQANIDPKTVGLIEAHGTGTPVGDATEIRALSRIFGEREGEFPATGIGTVKSMISHVMPAAGIAGIIKTALALYHQTLPPTLHVDEPIAELEDSRSNLYINSETRPWIHGSGATRRRAGVNAFGFGGINGHVILEEAPAAAATNQHDRLTPFDTELFILTADSREDLLAWIRQVKDFVTSTSDFTLRDLAYTLNLKYGDGTYKLAIVAHDVHTLQERLAHSLKRMSSSETNTIRDVQGIYYENPGNRNGGKLAFLFPGEGSQYENMLADLCMHFPEIRSQFDQIDSIFRENGRRYLPSDIVFPRPAFTREEREAAAERIRQMEGAVEAVLTGNRAMAHLLESLGIRPDVVVGHSTGEYSAMMAAGMLNLDDPGRLSRFSSKMNEMYQGFSAGEAGAKALMIAVAAGLDALKPVVEHMDGAVFVAMDNCPHQTVLVCQEDARDVVIAQLQQLGLIYEFLSIDRPYHTPLYADYAAGLQEFLGEWIVTPPAVPTYSCTTTEPFPASVPLSVSTAHRHWLEPVRFRETIERMYADGVRTFVEVGAAGNLTAFVKDILRGKRHVAIAADVKSRPGITQLNHLVGLLVAQGVPVQVDYLYRFRHCQMLDLSRPQGDAAPGTSSYMMKLATGWPPMELSEATAAKLREKMTPKRSGGGDDVSSRAERTQTKQDDSVEGTAQLPRTSAQTDTGAGVSGNGHSTRVDEPRPNLLQDGPLSDESSPVQALPALEGRQSDDRVMLSHFETMKRFLETQEEVMATLLGNVGAEPAEYPSAEQASSPAPSVAEVHPPSSPAKHETPVLPEQVAEAAVPLEQTEEQEHGWTAASIEELLLQFVSDRTGYPVAMLDQDVDLEAELGIDSIKRVEILGALQKETDSIPAEDMETLTGLKTLRQVVNFLTERLEQGQSAAAEASGPGSGDQEPEAEVWQRVQAPLIDEVRFLSPEKLVAKTRIDVAKHLFLRDHTLGRRVSAQDPELFALPIMPLTGSMEMLAEAASLLVPDQLLVEMREIRAHRWITLETGTADLWITARRLADASGVTTAGPGHSDEVLVEVVAEMQEAEVGKDGGQRQRIVEGTMVFADHYSEPPTRVSEASANEPSQFGPSKWRNENLYREGMFHGPLFQGVRSIDKTAATGSIATLQPHPRQLLFADDVQAGLLTDLVLLDLPGQVVGFWTAEHLKRSWVIFPTYVESLRMYSSTIIETEAEVAAGQETKCHARSALVGDHGVRSDLYVIDGNGQLWFEFTGWEDRRFDVPDAFYDLLLSPANQWITHSWTNLAEKIPSGMRADVRRVLKDRFPPGFFVQYGEIWLQTLANLILGRQERDLWERLASPGPRRLEWLMGRLAAKDAVRAVIEQEFATSVLPADVEILNDENGRPYVAGWRLVPEQDAPFTVSIAHKAGHAVAVAVLGDQPLAVDLELAASAGEAIDEIAFSSAERNLMAEAAHGDLDAWRLRFWCAKEAAAKVVGTGLSGGPRSAVVHRVDAADGVIDVLVKSTDAGGTLVRTYTLQDGDFLAALGQLVDEE